VSDVHERDNVYQKVEKS